MNEYLEKSLYDILDNRPTNIVKLYYVICLDQGDKDGMNVADNILRCRGESYETA